VDANIVNTLACKLCKALTAKIIADKYGVYCPETTDVTQVGTYLFVAEDSTCDLDHTLECAITDYASDQGTITATTTEESVTCSLEIFETILPSGCTSVITINFNQIS